MPVADGTNFSPADSLEPEARAAFAAVAAEYLRRTGEELCVTSGRRTLRRQAELMAAFSPEQLEGMYCRNGYPSYIRTMVETMQRTGRPLTADEVYEILRQRSEGYISSHLYGAALDIATDGLSQPILLQELLRNAGFRTMDETSLGIRCIHGTYAAISPQIIKE